MIGRPQATEARKDISPYLIHLTRDDTDEWPNGSGQSAYKNFLGIINEGKILAVDVHCLHRKNTRGVSTQISRSVFY